MKKGFECGRGVVRKIFGGKVNLLKVDLLTIISPLIHHWIAVILSFVFWSFRVASVRNDLMHKNRAVFSPSNCTDLLGGMMKRPT